MWQVSELEQRLKSDFGLNLPIQQWLDEDDKLHEDKLRDKILEAAIADYQLKIDKVGADPIKQFEKSVMLQTLDQLWKEHLAAMDHLRQGIHLRGYAQKNPKQEYKRESYELFTQMLEALKLDVVSILSRVQVQAPEEVEAMEAKRREAEQRAMQFRQQQAAQESEEQASESGKTVIREGQKVGRNDPCPCGSGKKYKQCHGKLS
jgi:preprotein translocase subunit SecA